MAKTKGLDPPVTFPNQTHAQFRTDFVVIVLQKRACAKTQSAQNTRILGKTLQMQAQKPYNHYSLCCLLDTPRIEHPCGNASRTCDSPHKTDLKPSFAKMIKKIKFFLHKRDDDASWSGIGGKCPAVPPCFLAPQIPL
jgi:hypothetical protein